MFFCLENVYSTGGFACGMKLVGSFDSWSIILKKCFKSQAQYSLQNKKVGTISRRNKTHFFESNFLFNSHSYHDQWANGLQNILWKYNYKNKNIFFRFTMSQNVLLHHKQTIEPTGWLGGKPFDPQKFRKTTPQSQKEDKFLLLQ